MMQPVPRVSHSDVTRIVRRDYPPAAFDHVCEILAAYGAAPGENGADRVRLAALTLAAGSVPDLEEWVAAAKGDPRDVLAAAEYPFATKEWSRLELLSDAEQQKAFDSDWDQYRRWLTRPGDAP